MVAAINEDHRVRVAKMRRERMVARLLQAVMECYAEHVLTGPPTVDEVIRRADVSRATFYKYFNSVDEAIEQRASELVDEMVESLKDLVNDRMKPILLFTVSVHLFLLRSVLDKTWGAFVARSDLLRSDGVLFQGMTSHLAAALEAHEVRFSDAEAARMLAIGTMREAIRAISQTDSPRRPFVDQVMAMILIGLGIECDVAAALVNEATIFIRGAAPDRLTWWRDPWHKPG
ncbi:TetR/AcrR family transcriptional regulator [Stakelama tenebrarum]|uniref:TetR/AcrR family transcriptional regulator n=1 Tax=Stakelama tenebrarum TaxID=2711215 RepID=A0A6G6Y1D1_9SPHN|nr:TetR/AcrR family transcriptional regulator [Sphingosinithalassobacter tenebrarum]QIG78617.1 TetR/AcrR family transcriptional regulator [Sphingosinithalassobacter tenebrarum]